MRDILLSILLLSSLLLAQGDKEDPIGEEVYKKKCASCHQLYISPSKLLNNFMEHNNTIPTGVLIIPALITAALFTL